MYFALGFLVAGLFMLMFLPAFWRRAMRLSMRRLQMLVPLSMEEVAAERDLLRAEFATGYRRLEQQMEAVKAAKAQDMVTIGLSAARIADLYSQVTEAKARISELQEKLRDTRNILKERTDLLGSTEAALHEMTERAERGVARLRNSRSGNEKIGRISDRGQARDRPTGVASEAERVGGGAAAGDEAEGDLLSGDPDVLALRQAIVEMGARMAEIITASEVDASEAPQSKRAL
ncbi:MAG: hypothetical protein HYS06_07420 [Methylocystis sp.]|nr:hypothetical protein [Methylocystis sp.]MBI3274839.1 hypothetical protein [Methylocystis sp.]